jgi:hypothetical protein
VQASNGLVVSPLVSISLYLVSAVQISKPQNTHHLTTTWIISALPKNLRRQFLIIKESIQQRMSFISHLSSTNLISIGFSCPHFYDT